MSQSELQYAGEYLIDECKIISTTGQPFDIIDIVETINFYEHIYSNTITGSIILKDTTNIVMNLPIIGEERLSLKILTPQTSPQPETVIDYTLTPLIIHKINTQEGVGENAQIVSLQFCSIESFRNQTSRVSQSYKGTTTDIVEKILRDEQYLRSKKRFYKESSANLAKVVFPNYRPFKCIDYLTTISNSATNNSSPSYLFFETTKGYHFRTFDGLCKEPIKFYFREHIGSELNESKATDAKLTMETLVKFQRVQKKDTLNNINNGMISSRLITHDVYNKKIDNYNFDYLSNFPNDFHPDEGESRPIISQSPDPETGKILSEQTDTKLYVTSTSFGQSFSEGENYPYQSENYNQTIQRKHSRMSQFSNGIVLSIEVPGQTFIQVGDKINLEVGSTSTTVDETDDDSLTGTYIVMKLRHIFIQSRENKHRILMEVARDSKIGDVLPSQGVGQTETGTSETIEV